MLRKVLLATAWLASAVTAATGVCSSSGIPIPEAFGTNITSLVAEDMTDAFGVTGLEVCYVVITLTHPGTGDSVNNYLVLPKNWNGRLEGSGGGGYVAGDPLIFGVEAAKGYAIVATDAGHILTLEATQDATSWALVSPGNVNQYGLLNFARRSIHDMTVIAKDIIESYYGEPARHSYWNGCSTGGRQGLALAQYYPYDYDGILADAPAIHWTALVIYGGWVYAVLNDYQYYPEYCEMQAVTDAIVKACDGLDGVIDNIVSAPGICNFDGNTLRGKTYTCFTDGSQRTFAPQIPDIVNKIWQGPHTPQGQFLWWGLIRGANFTGLYTDQQTTGLQNTPDLFPISDSWIRGFIAKDLNFNASALNTTSYPDLFLRSHLEYDSIIGTASPDLRPFRNRGGKMITWQGLADPQVNPQGTIQYYQGVQAIDPSVHDFYRLFFSPGTDHCSGGIGTTPIDALGQLVAWVENGTAPDTLKAASAYPVGTNYSSVVNGTNARFLNLCPWPIVTKYSGHGDPNCASSYFCADQRGWEEFPQGPDGRSYNFFEDPGWYAGDTNVTAGFL